MNSSRRNRCTGERQADRKVKKIGKTVRVCILDDSTILLQKSGEIIIIKKKKKLKKSEKCN